jgi:hypothetical protein
VAERAQVDDRGFDEGYGEGVSDDGNDDPFHR